MAVVNSALHQKAINFRSSVQFLCGVLVRFSARDDIMSGVQALVRNGSGTDTGDTALLILIVYRVSNECHDRPSVFGEGNRSCSRDHSKLSRLVITTCKRVCRVWILFLVTLSLFLSLSLTVLLLLLIIND